MLLCRGNLSGRHGVDRPVTVELEWDVIGRELQDASVVFQVFDSFGGSAHRQDRSPTDRLET